jgi:hypothetical protein
MTGSTTLAFQIYESWGHQFPIVLYHFLEYLGVDIKMDIETLNNEWIGLKNYEKEFSHIILRPLNNT